MPEIDLGSWKVNYEQIGAGQDVLLIAGLAGDMQAWRPQVEDLAGRYRLTLFDNPGAGSSGVRNGSYGIDDLGDDTTHIMDRLGIASAHIVGRSMGGAIGLSMAIRHPDRVRSVTALSAFAKLSPYGQRILSNWARVVASQGWSEAAAHMPLFLFTPSEFESSPEDVARLEASLCNVRPESYARSNLACREYDARPELSRISCPVLAVVGEKDLLCPVECSEALAQGIPGSRLVVLPDAGHLLPVRNSGEVNRLIVDFIG